MKHGIQKQIAQTIQISQSHLSELLSGKANASYNLAKRLAAFFHTQPEVWIEGTANDRAAVLHGFDNIEQKSQ